MVKSLVLMNVALQVTEPGSYPVKIDLEKRWGPDFTVVIGVARANTPDYHIAFRKANGFLSRRQVTVKAMNGDPNKLLIRDGGKGENEMWSPEWKHTFINDVPLSHTDWRSFNLGDRIRFHTEKPQLAGYSLQIAYDRTDNTLTGSQTISFDVVSVWESMSRANRDKGILLLSVPHNDGTAILQRIDRTGEAILGADDGELISAQEHLIFNNMVDFNQRRRLTEHISEAMVQTQAIPGTYTFGENKVNLRLERRPVNGQMPLFGWVALETPAQVAKPTSSGDWRRDAVKWANDHPLIAGVVAVVVAVAIAVIKLAVG